MNSSEQGLIDEDGTQAPLLANEEQNEDSYRVEPSLQERKYLYIVLYYQKFILFLDGTPARYVSR
jgi:hypothetical protein